MFTVYGMSDSGNCYKVKLALEQLALPYRWVEVDPARGETRSAAFLAMNANGKVPMLALEDGGFLPESNAILNYLAEGSRLLPQERLGRARVLQWMFFEQYSHEPFIATSRFLLLHRPERGHVRIRGLPRRLRRHRPKNLHRQRGQYGLVQGPGSGGNGRHIPRVAPGRGLVEG